MKYLIKLVSSAALFLAILSITTPSARAFCDGTKRVTYMALPCNITAGCNVSIGVQVCSAQGAGIGCDPDFGIVKCSDFCGVEGAESCNPDAIVVSKTEVNPLNLVSANLLRVSSKISDRSTCGTTLAFDDWLKSYSNDSQRADLNLAPSRPIGR